LQALLQEFIEQYIVPRDRRWHAEVRDGTRYPGFMEELKEHAREQGLWNLFLPALRPDEPGTPLSNLEYAPLAEIMGRIPWAPEVFNCSAPDTGNMELLHLYATPDQRAEWLDPLLRGEVRSCFAMSEPDVASSDPTNIQTRIRREGGEYVVTGRKWFVTGSLHPLCRLAIVMGVSDPDADPHARHSMVLVPLDTPGVQIVRNIPVLHHESPDGHGEIVFRDVRVPASNILGEEGSGFAQAQARLGPGRIHHCMRTIGQCELALELMCARALERRAFGKRLADYSNVQEWIAKSRIEIDQARMYTLAAAAKLDRVGSRGARVDVAGIKVVAPRLQVRVLDRAIQVFGAMGLTPDTPLAYLFTWGRALRIVDGPDEVHLRVVARDELRKAKHRAGSLLAYVRGS
jgi:acyl-CoA dehydrogenase